MFFESLDVDRRFAVQDIEHIIALTEITLQTFYKNDFRKIQDKELKDEHISFDMIYCCQNNEDSIYRYLLNVRIIGVILANIFWNQLKLIVN
jgi:hypothetical protein